MKLTAQSTTIKASTSFPPPEISYTIRRLGTEFNVNEDGTLSSRFHGSWQVDKQDPTHWTFTGYTNKLPPEQFEKLNEVIQQNSEKWQSEYNFKASYTNRGKNPRSNLHTGTLTLEAHTKS
jgi:hypothetical protein